MEMNYTMNMNEDNANEVTREDYLKVVPGWQEVETELLEMRKVLHAFFRAHESVVEAFEYARDCVRNAYDNMPGAEQDGAIGSNLREQIEEMDDQLEILQDLDVDDVYRSFEPLLDDDSLSISDGREFTKVRYIEYLLHEQRKEIEEKVDRILAGVEEMPKIKSVWDIEE